LNAESWHWILRSLEKFALFGVPASITLLFWKRRRIKARGVYRASWANVCGYLLWLLAVILTAKLSHIPAVTFSFLPATVAFVWPFFAAIGPFILCLFCMRGEMEEQPFIALSNFLMLILWVSSVVAPN
jgi:hypothetical protein